MASKNLSKGLLTLFLILSFVSNLTSQVAISEHCFSGDAKDKTSNGNDGINISATITTDRFGDTSSAYAFNGINQSITLPHQQYFNHNEFSYSIWVNVAQNPSIGNASCVLQVSGPPMDHTILLTNNYVGRTGWVFSSYDDFIAPNPDHPDVAKSSGLPSINQWNHLVCTRSTKAVKLYINNVLVDSAAIMNPRAGYSTTNKYVTLGNRNQGIQYFNGSIDDLSIYSEALNSAQVDSLYKNKLCVITNPTDTTKQDTTIKDTTGLEERLLKSVNVYPNPTNGRVNVEFGEEKSEITYLISDVTGKLVSRESCTNVLAIELSLILNPGVYFLKIFEEGELLNQQKLVLK